MVKISIDQYFLNEECPYSHKKKLNTKNIKLAAAGLVLCLIGSVLFFGGKAEKAKVEEPLKSESVRQQTEQTSQGSIALGSYATQPAIQKAAGVSNRQYGASQIVRRSNGSSGGEFLPMGSTVKVRLQNTVLSSDNASPVIAEVTEDVYWKNTSIIPQGTKAIGQASLDDTTKRLQVRFHTLVYPEGDQHSVSALAMLGDGSSGIPGDYHSGTFQKRAGQFVGDFVGGLAEGMKEKQVGSGRNGTVYEPGSLKNGLLNGLSLSAFDQAKAYSDDMKGVRAYLEVPGGTECLIYFEKEYSP